MKRRLLLIALAFGTVAGYTSAAFQHQHHRYHHAERHRAFEEHVADVCVAAARRQSASER
jgi:hypothetical protein